MKKKRKEFNHMDEIIIIDGTILPDVCYLTFLLMRILTCVLQEKRTALLIAH